MSKHQIHRVGVIGSGVMGTGIAAHLASAGVDVLLVDILPRDAPSAVPSVDPAHPAVRAARNATARAGLDRALTLKPAVFQRPDDIHRIEIGNLEDDVGNLGQCDWVVEAVTERLAIKQAVFDKIELSRAPHTIVSSNTSGIPLATLLEGRTEAFCNHFLITHFFNPVRYMKLVEIIAGERTDPEVTGRMAAFVQDDLGKGVVHAKDTINFIANRIGVHDMMRAVRIWQEEGYRIEEVDAICGEALGRPRSAVFRTADVVGLDTLGHVARNCYDNLTQDPNRSVFDLPKVLSDLIASGRTGQKAGAGFYKKVGNDIQVLDATTGEYVAQQPVDIASLAVARRNPDVAGRVRDLLLADDRGGRFAWGAVSHTLVYAAELLGTIADDITGIDRAMRWGFNWSLGPFEIWDAVGVATVADRLRAEGRAVPEVVTALLRSGETSFYRGEPGGRQQLGADGLRRPEAAEPGIHLDAVRAAGGLIESNPSAELLDLGDGVLGLSFRSKMNALDADIIDLCWRALQRIDEDGWRGMVIANDGPNFSVGANLKFIAGLAREGRWSELEEAVRAFQTLFMAIKRSVAPVVAAPHQMALGGGCEIALHASRMQAAAETYMGLVEVGVGLLPAAGGTKELAVRVLAGVPADSRVDRVLLLQQAFEMIALGKVTTGAGQMRDFKLLRPVDGISVDGGRRIEDAKRVVLQLVASHYRPDLPATNLNLPGSEGIALFDMALYSYRVAGQASEHDCIVGHEIARVLCGGERGGMRSEQDLLDLERESFLRLCSTEKTRDRIDHMLKTGKPLRN